ncbi:methyl-accepting chemotaxis protein [Desulfovibrio cuneatus]|uniref:methyl-accepting chemotaxis protein n=1 Tax=Desulfovibrio cuneatus TaxID=159728 RepID=UPI0003F76216|nr:methyl-accepting chemotaxis protein [Desulfovibrio cuneatus]
MTTKYKIAIGFCLMILIAITVAFIGNRGITTATHEFAEYRRLARFNTVASDLLTELNALSGNTVQFLSSRSPQFINKAEENFANIAKQLEFASSLSQQESNRASIAREKEDLNKARSLPAAIRETLLAGHGAYTNQFLLHAKEMANHLHALRNQGAASNNDAALANLSDVWEEFCILRGSAGIYSESRNVEDGGRVKESLLRTGNLLATLEKTLQQQAEKNTFAIVQAEFAKVTQGIQTMERQFAAVATSVQAMTAFLTSATEELIKLNTQRDAAAIAGAKNFEQSNASAQQLMLAVSASAILVGIGFALYIVLGLVRVLNNVGTFANAVANGNFNSPIPVREKGEIGTMVGALKQIPEVLQKLMAETTGMTEKVMAGSFMHRSNAEAFPGVFGDLSRSVNAVAQSYTTVLHNLPNPIVTCGVDFKLKYQNLKAQEMLGGNKIGQECSSCFQAEACNTQNCFGKATLASKASNAGETIVHPKPGVDQDIAVTASPLHNTQGEVVGFLEMVTDLTEIKRRERTMHAVAQAAAEVANRVSEATDKLSHQVEQISHGAELQRSRVESTATAMAQMNDTVLEVARSAGEAAQQSEETQKKAVSGEQLVEKAVTSINAVNNMAAVLQQDMEKLGTLATNIDGVILVISDIADQTNLLALNAAIEAARAGEAGRGFAVVADEVRKLAEKTMNATQEVSGSIHAIQQSARVSIDGVHEVVNTIQGATEYTNASGDALRQIVQIASSSSSIVSAIATAAEEQSATSEEINRAIEEISSIVGETTNGMLESSQAVQELAHTAQELDAVMEQLK